MASKKPLTKEEKRLETLAAKTEEQKKVLVVQLRKMPIVQVACERTGIGRSTYYKWRAYDKIFARVADKALEAGKFFVNDLARSKLLGKIQAGDMTAIIFWLKHNDPTFAPVNRIVHEYEVVTEKPSVEEQHAHTERMSRLLARGTTQKFTVQEVKEQIEEELEEAEREEPDRKRMEAFEEDQGEK